MTEREYLPYFYGNTTTLGTSLTEMINNIFDWCVDLLILAANQLGITYKAINVWVFVIIWPVFTILLIGMIIFQNLRIRRLLKRRGTKTEG